METNLEQYVGVGRRKLQGQHVIPVMVSVPSKMLEEGQEKIDALKELLELRCSAVGGLNSGITVELGEADKVLGVTKAKSEPWMEFPELENGEVKNFLNEFTERYVVGNTLDQLRDDGLVLAFIEPDPTYTTVVRAWMFRGVVFKNTGITEGRRNVNGETQGLVYHVPLLFSSFDDGQKAVEFAQGWLNSCQCVDLDTKTGAVSVHANTTTD